MKKWILVGVLFAGLGVGLAFRLIPGNKQRAPAERAPVAAVSAPSPQTIVATNDHVARQQFAALSSDVSALRAELARATQQPASRANDTEAQPASPEQAAQLWREHMEQVAVEYEMETRDARWARDTESKIRGALATSRVLSDAVESLDCRSASCRIQLKPSQASNFDEDLLRVVHEVGSFLPSTQLDAADPAAGKRSTVIYLKTNDAEVAL
jgi:hypothetical protein